LRRIQDAPLEIAVGLWCQLGCRAGNIMPSMTDRITTPKLLALREEERPPSGILWNLERLKGVNRCLPAMPIHRYRQNPEGLPAELLRVLSGRMPGKAAQHFALRAGP
jgi:hypothetical protein